MMTKISHHCKSLFSGTIKFHDLLYSNFIRQSRLTEILNVLKAIAEFCMINRNLYCTMEFACATTWINYLFHHSDTKNIYRLAIICCQYTIVANTGYRKV